MHALDACHLNIRGRAGPRNPGHQPRQFRSLLPASLLPCSLAPCSLHLSKYSGSVSTTWLARTTHRCQSGSSVITRRPSVAEWCRTMVPDSATPQKHAVTTPSALLNFARRQAAVDLPVESRSKPLCRQSRRRDELVPAARRKLCRDRCRKLFRRAFHHFRIVFAQPLDQPLLTGPDRHVAVPHIVARQRFVRTREPAPPSLRSSALRHECDQEPARRESATALIAPRSHAPLLALLLWPLSFHQSMERLLRQARADPASASTSRPRWAASESIHPCA